MGNGLLGASGADDPVGSPGTGMGSAELEPRRPGAREGPPAASVAGAPEAAAVLVRGPVAGLSAVLGVLRKAGGTGEFPVSWEPTADKDSQGLARDLGIGTGSPRELTLVRDDHGGVLLHHGRIEADNGGRRSLSSRLEIGRAHV